MGVLVSVKTRPESRARALELLQAGPPFDPSATCITQHDVFLLDDQVLFLCETDERLETEESPMDAWRWAESWRDLVVEVENADHVYSWTRPTAAEPVSSRLGLGF